MELDEIIKKINSMSDGEIEDNVAALELELVDDEVAAINASANNLSESKDTCALLHIPYDRADDHYAKLQLYAYYLKQD